MMESLDSLPYIDADISAAQREAANRLIQRELPRRPSTTVHPSLPQLPPSRLTPALQQEVDRARAGQPLSGGVDLARYESPDNISTDSNLEILKSALRTAYANIAYLRGRQTNIALLEEYGKNAWLISNSHLDDVQKRLEAQLATTVEQSENTNRSRKAVQEDSRGELLSLDDTWKQAISKIIETQLATENLRNDLAQLPKSSNTAS